MDTKNSRNVFEMIDAFETYESYGVFDDYERNDKFLRYLLDRSKIPSFRLYKKIVVGQEIVGAKGESRDIVKEKRITIDELTAEQLTEMREVQTLMGNTTEYKSSIIHGDSQELHADYAQHSENYCVLRDLITKFPPVLQEQVLIIAIVIYMLRHLDVVFDCDTNSFGEFFQNYKEIVIGV